MTRQRTIIVQIDEIAIEDGQIEPPKLGAVIEFPLRFAEQPASDAGTVTIRALLEASNRDPVFQYTGPDSPRRWEWNGVLRGDGWTASWRGFTPRTGYVELTGRFYGVMGYDTPTNVRGRVTRVQLVTERYRRPPENHGWHIVPGHRELRDVEVAPRFFNHDMFMHDDLFEVDREVGVVVDLDLDHVPPVPARPSIVPGDVSASGETLWVVDRELPVVVSIDSDRVAREHVLPGPIGYSSRHVWATLTGCWVGGKGGLYRCEIGEEPRRANPRSVHQGAVIGEHFLACPSGTSWSLYSEGNEPVVVDVADGYVRSIAVDGESFVVLIEQLHADVGSSNRLVRVTVTGETTVGPELATVPGRRGASPYLAGAPLRIFHSGTASRVLPDLALGAMEQLDGDPFHGGQVGDFVWIIGHPPRGTSRTGWWPLQGPVEYDRTRQFWLFTLLDSRTLEPVKSTPIFTTNPAVSIDSAGTVWVIADGLQSVPEESMQWPTSLDVAALLGTHPHP
ncbi:DUF6578 domain-containing protein [uncultured Rhodococcus sp.]|uniref:DUF6578 domain-containing protein n=1 Tax=uncultured Rhodococcus sp. TaxID=194249 RepID=UPI0028DB22F9|nr:DUF6578 domain-containing protein [uncultured Rhodococcus sp.]